MQSITTPIPKGKT